MAVETSIDALRAQMVGKFSSPIQLVALDKTAYETHGQSPHVPEIDEGVPEPGTSDVCQSTPRRRETQGNNAQAFIATSW